MSHSRQVLTISYESAAALVAHAVEHARSQGWQVCVVVVDPFGHPMASGRMDGVPVPVFDYASDKAFTAATQGKTTRAFYERMSSAPDDAMGLANRDRLCVWEGGLPVRENGLVIGGIGVSGAAGKEDVACAERALAAVGLS